MARQIKCECGYVARAETDDEVIDLIERHVRTDHPELAEPRLAKRSPAGSRSWTSATRVLVVLAALGARSAAADHMSEIVRDL